MIFDRIGRGPIKAGHDVLPCIILNISELEPAKVNAYNFKLVSMYIPYMVHTYV